MIYVEELVKKYQKVAALADVTLQIDAGQIAAVMGPSGSGKTTLINLLSGLDSPTSGRISINGETITEMSAEEKSAFRRENIGIVFQQFHLIPYLTAVENIMLAQYLHSLPDRNEALAALEKVGLADRADHRPDQLSGGEQQRVAIARAIINDPAVVLSDEPTGNLDEDNEARVMDILTGLKDEGKTIVLVTHNRELAAISDRIIEIHHGRIQTPLRETALA
jgi:putative ABC transport system ATP-binding protein